MAITQCPDCGKDVSTAAPTCPGCGHPFRRGPVQVVTEVRAGQHRDLKIGAGVIVAAIIILPLLIGLLVKLGVFQ